MENICIIGNGIAGITAARHIRKLKSANVCGITVISAETDHFFSRTALMYIYMGHMTYEHTKPYEDWFWGKNNITLVRDYVTHIDIENKQLMLEKGKPVPYHKLLLATGSKGNRPGWKGENLKGVQGMITYQDIEAMEANTKGIERAVIVGGGLIGIEMAECLASREIPVTFFIREETYWSRVLPREESEMVTRHIRKHGIDLRTGADFKEIMGDAQGRVKSVLVNDDETIACQFVGITVGVTPYINFLKDSEIDTDRGILVNEFLETNLPDIYAAGDCVQHRQAPVGRKHLEQIWYSGRMQGETVARTMCGEKTRYVPGVFFNSAKFFDIEYQIYGTIHVPPQDDEEQFYWEHPDGEKSVRIAFEKASGAVIGFNLMGIRYRHEVCDRWISKRASVQEVMRHLEAANFDPEFHKKYETDIVEKFNRQYPEKAVSPKKKKSLLAAIFS